MIDEKIDVKKTQEELEEFFEKDPLNANRLKKEIFDKYRDNINNIKKSSYDSSETLKETIFKLAKKMNIDFSREFSKIVEEKNKDRKDELMSLISEYKSVMEKDASTYLAYYNEAKYQHENDEYLKRYETKWDLSYKIFCEVGSKSSRFQRYYEQVLQIYKDIGDFNSFVDFSTEMTHLADETNIGKSTWDIGCCKVGEFSHRSKLEEAFVRTRDKKVQEKIFPTGTNGDMGREENVWSAEFLCENILYELADNIIGYFGRLSKVFE